MTSPSDMLMRRALELAERGLYTTTPNPRVGAVIVNDHGDILGEGWTQPAGQDHAEIQALKDAARKAHAVQGATLYVSLEPCAHFGRTPPCANALIDAGIKHVVAAMQDPNPLVGGKGFAILRAAGIQVTCGVLENEARALNEGFLSRITRGRPFVRLKTAASMDGRTALGNGQSKWITAEAARADGHHWRARACAVLTGSGTIVADDPQLNVRAVPTTRQPLRIVADTHLHTPLSARILQDGKVLLACSDAASRDRIEALRAAGAEVLECPVQNERLDLRTLVARLGQRGINELLVEAGPRLSGAFAQAGLVDEYLIYLAPALIGDAGRGMLALPEITQMESVSRFEIIDLTRVGSDLRVRLRPAGGARVDCRDPH